MTNSIGVGLLGAGQVTQAIHLPTLATLPQHFHVERVMDVNEHVARNVAARCNSKASFRDHEIYDDPKVEVAVICSPNAFHAEQVIACCRAKKKLVLCEKPLAVTREEAEEIRRVATETQTPIVVGTMHAYDPAYRAALTAWRELGEEASLVRSSIYLPSNDVYVDQATDQTKPDIAQVGGTPQSDPLEQRRNMFRMAILGLAIHNIPLIRDFYGPAGKVIHSSFVSPFGYSMALANDKQMATLQAMMPGNWQPHWSLDIEGKHRALRISFPPSYVLAGSCRAELVEGSRRTVFSDSRSGYEALWQNVSDIVNGAAAPIHSLDTVIADLGFALDLAENGANHMRFAA